jgi:FIST N domain
MQSAATALPWRRRLVPRQPRGDGCRTRLWTGAPTCRTFIPLPVGHAPTSKDSRHARSRTLGVDHRGAAGRPRWPGGVDAERKIFDRAVARLREQHARKRTVMGKLDARGWGPLGVPWSGWSTPEVHPLIRANSGLSLLTDPRAAGEAAVFQALLGCEDARDVLLFASHHHAAEFGAVAGGAAAIADPAYVSGCTGYGVATEAGLVVGVPAVAALAIAGDDFLIRPGQRPRGPADAVLLAREMGAPRGMGAYVLLAGCDAGDPDAILTGMSPSLPGFAVGLAGAWGEPTTLIGPDEVEPGGTLTWLLAGACEVRHSVTPGVEPDDAQAPPAFGIFLGTVDVPPPFPSRSSTFPVAGVVGAYACAAGGRRHPGVLLTVSPA